MRNLKSLLESAIRIAVEAHAHFDQHERNGHPYIMHPLRVMHRVRSDDEKIVAILHDVVEDCSPLWSLDRLKAEGFPQHIIDAIDCISIRKGEPYAHAIKRAASNPIARRVKLADLEDNMDIMRLPKIKLDDPHRLNSYLRVHRELSAIDRRQAGMLNHQPASN